MYLDFYSSHLRFVRAKSFAWLCVITLAPCESVQSGSCPTRAANSLPRLSLVLVLLIMRLCCLDGHVRACHFISRLVRVCFWLPEKYAHMQFCTLSTLLIRDNRRHISGIPGKFPQYLYACYDISSVRLGAAINCPISLAYPVYFCFYQKRTRPQPVRHSRGSFVLVLLVLSRT